MTRYPNNIDSDLELPRVDNNITEIGGDAINAATEAIVAIEDTLGVNPQGAAGTVAARLDTSLDSSGLIKAAALSGLGLITLPITSSMFGNYTIPEIKLVLDHSTASLFASVSSIGSQYTSLLSYYAILNSHFTEHLYGIVYDGYLPRHVASHVDINDGYLTSGIRYYGIDPRDSAYFNTGLLKTDGYIRNNRTVMDALIDINNDLILHLLSLSNNHPASFITLDTNSYNTIPTTITTVQGGFDFLDQEQTILLEDHRNSQHSTGIAKHNNVERVANDGYNVFWGSFDCSALYDTNGDSILLFTVPSDYSLDWAFRQITAGDHIRINYGGFEASFAIENTMYVPGSLYKIILDGYHLMESTTASAILEKSHYDENYFGKLAVCVSNHNFYTDPDSTHAIPDPAYPDAITVPGSAIVISPNCAMAMGMDLCLDELDATHYLLYLAIYPSGNPAVEGIYPTAQIKEIDVTGNLGVTPGCYTLQQIVDNVNNEFRKGGYNYRLVAFQQNGQFGIALADTINNIGFSIIYGVSDTSAGIFVNNVVDIVTFQDPLGLGSRKADIASPLYSTSNIVPTKVFVGRKNKKYNINGQFIDYLAPGYLTVNGCYNAQFINVETLGGAIQRLRGTYRVDADLFNTKLKPGSTIVVQPVSGAYSTDYGRFVVEEVDTGCDGYTNIKVVNCVSLLGDPGLLSLHPIISNPSTWVSVKIYFSDDSVNFSHYADSQKNYFEIYVSNNGETFSHRRALLPIQTGLLVALSTSLGVGRILYKNTYNIRNFGWNIVGVSPKFKGFLRSGSTSLDKYVRFVVTDYDAVSGTYEAYICQATTTASITTNVGATIKVRKGEVGRFYDYTGVDYIDILFADNEESPYTISLPSTYAFVDIQIFDTLRTNEEYLCLGSCEQLSTLSTDSLWYFNDLRQFGTVSEKILTTSAINYIESGDRLIHQNGVISGFELISYDAALATITINGGAAIVDGKVVNKNNMKVFVHNLYDAASSPTTLMYTLCITKDGSYALVPVSNGTAYASGAHDFYFDATNHAYIVLDSLEYLIVNRKDLLPLYMVEILGQSGSVAITDVKDIKKYTSNNEYKDYLVLYNSTSISSSDMPIGAFSTWEAVKNYVLYAGMLQSTILVRGTTTISTMIDFEDAAVNIIGDLNAVVICEVNGISIKLNSNITIDGVHFTRNFGTDVAAASFVPAKATLGISGSNTAFVYQNITIKNCIFDTAATKRSSGIAHILFEQVGSSGTFININILNNRFNESEAQLDIAFANRAAPLLASYPTDKGTILNNITIENNRGNFNSWILLSSDNIGSNTTRGLQACGIKIIGNTFDYLWYNLSRYVHHGYNGVVGTNVSDSYPQYTSEVEIINNTFVGIAPRTTTGAKIYSTGSSAVKVASPSMIITENKCSTIKVACNCDTYNPAITQDSGEVIISNNVLSSCHWQESSFTPLDSPYVIGYYGYAIQLVGSSASSTTIKGVFVNINGNIINDIAKGNKYNVAIESDGISCVVTNNIIDSCFITYGIFVSGSAFATANPADFIARVKNNSISRKAATVTAYISVFPETTNKEIEITDNFFDSSTVDGTDENTVLIAPNYAYTSIVQRNKNQTFEIDLMSHVIKQSNVTVLPGTLYAAGWELYSFFGYDIHAVACTFSETLRIFLQAHDDILPPNSNAYITPLIVSLPYVDGASIQEIKFYMSATKLNAALPDEIYFAAASQNNDGYSRVFDTTTNQYSTVPTFMTRNASVHFNEITIDVSALQTNHATVQSNSRTIPVIIYFLATPGGSYAQASKRADIENVDTILIQNIRGIYKY